MDWQNLAYAATQIVHNFGAVAVVGGAACVLIGWATQAASGATFGAISFYHYGKFPDIHGIAVAALGVKMACAALGFTLAAWQLFAHPSAAASRQAWLVLCGLGALALSSAAVLRWFS
ncbi:MAG: hypothetical protein A2Y51_04270 [Gallionellales bacterium RIFCSPLOWO2_02_60_31]|nr:MAG: hypothetical protein A2Y51_04270 [Gallionellales bacterium RIFCSPLOWO2_02_60_31]